ncbi:DUF3710 domain-containing protein [Corynebacterium aurimucosum]|uniref:DUF3710 domain-containing protein n=1 Tax=Corynebacterium aurimucosum (strain ATCC 700975 / DSM 44827 / CIP 107346 / CN-1) TaxID=548476 RepID=C3PGT6_CORA7|nr:DUF3710 domain-containing protein [Corynebacterium aurimucosum]ACP33040.1 hypothetical protein cauri_1447 [Corynebacterium aurimucosum ATCC 700975]QQU92823.1 DUF3710 domain-containing protein [Corynebacterium aurimucosum]
MAMWPFGKKKKDENKTEDAGKNPDVRHDEAVPESAETVDDTAASAPADSNAGPVREDSDVFHGVTGLKAVAHDAINGEMGPYDGDNVDIAEFNFEDFSVGLLDLGSMRIPLPKGSQVQVEMGQDGPRMLHILTPHGRMTPVAFAAPRTPGQWAESAEDIVQGLEADGFAAHPEDGPWGSEIVGSSDKGGIRIIGVEGPRWMYRLTLAAPAGKEEELAKLGREVVARTFIYRGEEPILAGSSLPVMLPQQLAEQVQQALKQRQQQAADADNTAAPEAASATAGAENAAEAQAREQLRDLEDNEKN